MKIEPTPKIFDIVKPRSQENEKNKPSQTFGDILSEKTQSSASSASHKISGPPPLAGLSPVNLMPSEQRVNKSVVIDKLEKLLDVLDQYQMQIENQNISLRDIEPITRNMMDRVDELAPELDKLDPDDSLSPILNETLVTVSLEVKKFENGWYNP